MLTGKDALIIFYSVFWGLLLSSIGRYHLFDTHLLFGKDKVNRKRAIKRLIVGISLANVLPALWFWALYVCVVPSTGHVLSILSSVFASLSIFGFNRIIHAVVATRNYHWFYSQKELGELMERWGREDPSKGSNTFIAHFLPGLCYIIVFSSLAYAIALASNY